MNWLSHQPSPQQFGFDEPPLPESTITKPPSAELRPDHKMRTVCTYDRLDRVLEAWIEHGVAEMLCPNDLVGEILPMVNAVNSNVMHRWS